MKKQLLVAAILCFSGAAVMAQTTDSGTRQTAVKKHPIKSRLHKIGKVIKEPHAPSAPAQPKP